MLADPVVTRPNRVATSVNLLLFIGLVGYVAREVIKVWPKLIAHPWTLTPLPAISALLMLLACGLLDVVIWNRTLGWFVRALPYRQAAPIYLWSYLARYIPGKVFSLVLRISLSTQVGLPVIPVLTSSLVELALRTAGALVLAVPLLLHGVNNLGNVKWVGLGLLPAILLCAHPRVMLPLMNWGLRKLKRPQLPETLRYRDILGLCGLLVIRWVGYGTAFVLLTRAVGLENEPQMLFTGGVAVTSWAAGFLGMSPGGLGITEITFMKLLPQAGIAAEVAVGLALLFRALTLLAEGLLALLAWGVRAWTAPAAVSVPEEVPMQQ